MGYKDQICADFSTVVVKAMSLKHSHLEGITWMHTDVRNMDQILTASVDVAFDKGTLDAMIHGSPWDPPEEVLDNTSRYIREVGRRRFLHRLRYRCATDLSELSRFLVSLNWMVSSSM